MVLDSQRSERQGRPEELAPLVEAAATEFSCNPLQDCLNSRAAPGAHVQLSPGQLSQRLVDARLGSKSSEVVDRSRNSHADEQDVGQERFGHRAVLLIVLLLFQSASSVVLKRFHLLVQRHPAVIYFLTMLVGAGGNAGAQSTIVVIRKLAVASYRAKAEQAEVKASEVDVEVAGDVGATEGDECCGDRQVGPKSIICKETLTGAALALLLVAASFVRCSAFEVTRTECVAICLSMAAIVVTSTVLGASLPLLLQRIGHDPAHAGPVIQVAMDIIGVVLTCAISCYVLDVPFPIDAGSPSAEAAVRNATSTSADAGKHEVVVDAGHRPDK